MKFKKTSNQLSGLILLLIIICTPTILSAQVYRVFQVNNQYGLVHSQTLDEMLIPQKNFISAFGNNYWKFTDGDSFIFINNSTAIQHSYLKAKCWASFSMNSKSYIVVEKNGKQQLLNSDLKLFPLQGDYFKMEVFGRKSDKIIGSNKSYSDIYEFHNGILQLKHHLLANVRITLPLIHQNAEQDYYIFYGQNHIYVVDMFGNLKHTTEAKADGKRSVVAALHPNFRLPPEDNSQVSLGTGEVRGSNEVDEFYIAKLRNWTVLKTTDEHYYFGKFSVPFAIVIPKDYWLSYDKKQDQISIYKEQHNCTFTMDTVKGNIYLPKQYQQEFGIRVVPYVVKETDDTTIYQRSDVLPQPPVNWLNQLEIALNITIEEGFVGNNDKSVSFIVNQDGSLVNFRFNPNVKDETQKQAITQYLNQHNKGWSPAKQSGLKVRGLYTIKFKMK